MASWLAMSVWLSPSTLSWWVRTWLIVTFPSSLGHSDSIRIRLNRSKYWSMTFQAVLLCLLGIGYSGKAEFQAALCLSLIFWLFLAASIDEQGKIYRFHLFFGNLACCLQFCFCNLGTFTSIRKLTLNYYMWDCWYRFKSKVEWYEWRKGEHLTDIEKGKPKTLCYIQQEEYAKGMNG